MFTTLYAGIRRSQTHTYARSLYFFDLRHTVGEDMLLLQMGNKRIETVIVRHDVEMRILVGCGNATNVECYMKVERIVPRAHHLNVLGARTEFLNRLDQGERQLGLVLSDEQQHLDPLLIKKFKIVGYDILKIY